MKPKITVLMTVYNGERYLKECMDSVLNQTFRDFEFLIVNDCGADSSKDIINSYKDNRIKMIENDKNIGQVRSLNIGLDRASGEYIARIDQDDVLMPNRLARESDFLDKRQDIALVGTWGKVIDEKSVIFGRDCVPVRNEEIIANIFFVGYFIMHPSVLFRKEPVMDVGKYNESLFFAEDYDLWARLSLKKYKLANIPEFLIKVRHHRERTSRQFHQTQLNNTYISILNFIRVIMGGSKDSDLELLCNFLISAGLMKKEYFADEKNITHLQKTIDLLQLLLEKIEAYYDLKKSEVYLVKKVFYTRILNFAYLAMSGKERDSLPLYLFCLKNYSYLFLKPKLYLYPLKSVL
ncbi:glycosyltransferase family 2 protein [Candidatus Omnitrophota bacterium]